MANNIEQRIRDSFEEDDCERVIKYLEWLLPSFAEYRQSMRRDSTIILLLIAIFELVTNSRNTGLSIGSFHVARGSLVLIFLPAVVSFLFFQIVLDSQKLSRLDSTFEGAFKIWAPKAYENEIHDLISGPVPAYWLLGAGMSDRKKDRFDSLQFNTAVILVLLVVVGIFAFEGLAYYVLLPAHPFEVAKWAISLSLTLTFLMLGIRFIFADADQ